MHINLNDFVIFNALLKAPQIPATRSVTARTTTNLENMTNSTHSEDISCNKSTADSKLVGQAEKELDLSRNYIGD